MPEELEAKTCTAIFPINVEKACWQQQEMEPVGDWQRPERWGVRQSKCPSGTKPLLRSLRPWFLQTTPHSFQACEPTRSPLLLIKSLTNRQAKVMGVINSTGMVTFFELLWACWGRAVRQTEGGASVHQFATTPILTSLQQSHLH